MTSLVGPAGPGPHTPEEHRNLDTVLALRRATVEGRAAFFAPGYRVHRHGMAHLAALGGFTDGTGYTAGSIADRRDRIEDIIARGDRVWAVWTIQGTHTGPLFGVEPTGRRLRVLELGIWRLVDGKVAEAWFFADEYGLAHSLGLLPTGSSPAASPGH
ncbi:SnoaL-like polyketide cyclase (plasmid) [Streptomyces sp. YIM 121038]|uniref:ester cyclase n=1 Tax=Streptomyces sp. YIM 121038 TaxID=2136401 RepID=UPI00111043B0|nr:ester cyclase [Streptomyces sp. YIM 121038]QCX82751.1 SnoaL-like polyketide cyclase [Streptomyces sp. YIM 121038]